MRSSCGLANDVEIDIHERWRMVTELYCRFTLPHGEPPPLSQWAGFAAGLCARFHLRLGAKGVAPCGAVEFLDAVRGHGHYRLYAAAFGWDCGPSLVRSGS